MMISERIFKLMEEQKISQREFSKRTGIAQSTICDWKRKKTNPAADKLIVICEVLQLSPYQLLTGMRDGKMDDGDSEYLFVDKTSSDFRLLEKYHMLSQDDRDRLLGYLSNLLKADKEKTGQAAKTVFSAEATADIQEQKQQADFATVKTEESKTANAEYDRAENIKQIRRSAKRQLPTELL